MLLDRKSKFLCIQATSSKDSRFLMASRRWNEVKGMIYAFFFILDNLSFTTFLNLHNTKLSYRLTYYFIYSSIFP